MIPLNTLEVLLMIKNISLIKKEHCCGCSACFSICPQKCIAMEADIEGFLYPRIDSSLCVNCGMCLTVCNNSLEKKCNCIDAVAFKNKNVNDLKKSSSGGVSSAIAKYYLDKGGIVYGVVYNDKYEAITSRLDSYEELEKLFGSKYVQTNPLSTFSQVCDDLKKNRSVVYFGTSCHIAGLLSYLDCKRINRENLLTVDLICHGTPSPKVFASYIKFLKKDKKFKSFEFRTKNKPWGYGSKNYGCTITCISKTPEKVKTQIDTPKTRIFLNLFFSNNCLRPRCHYCNFIGTDKPSDLTIADYWGAYIEEPDFFSEDGVSAVLIHTEKGKLTINSLSSTSIKKTSINKIAKYQGNLSHSSPVSPDRTDFWRLYEEKGFIAVAKKYGEYSLISRFKWLIKGLINRK